MTNAVTILALCWVFHSIFVGVLEDDLLLREAKLQRVALELIGAVIMIWMLKHG